MIWFIIQLFLHVVAVATSSAQTEKFEYECDILERLDRLEHELKAAKETQTVSDLKLTEAVATIHSLQNDLKEIASSGSTYVRWGRTTCPGNGTELVYSGSVGGSLFTDTGAAVDYICLPETPVYGQYNEDNAQGGGHVYGAEYQFETRADGMRFFPKLVDRTDLHQHDVPCAVCRTLRSAVLMVPARNTCMDGWTLEYKGMLFTENSDHPAASEYICLDDQPESKAGGSANLNGKLMYFVEGRCGSLQCPPYVNGRELTCAVCSK